MKAQISITMKNLFFSLAFMLIGTFTFANNSNQTVLTENLKGYDSYTIESPDIADNSVGTCYITLGFYDEDGNRLGGVVLAISGVDTQAQCNQLANQIENALNKEL